MNPEQQITTIRSILGHAEGRDPTTVLHEIYLATQGATLTEIHNYRTRKETPSGLVQS